jgi:transposase
MSESTFIGLDVHARSVWAGVLDGVTGEVRSCAAPVRSDDLVAWLRAQGEALSVAYEAGPLPASASLGPARRLRSPVW